MEEAYRLGRPFPISFPWNLLMILMPKERKDAAKEAMRYVLLEAK